MHHRQHRIAPEAVHAGRGDVPFVRGGGRVGPLELVVEMADERELAAVTVGACLCHHLEGTPQVALGTRNSGVCGAYLHGRPWPELGTITKPVEQLARTCSVAGPRAADGGIDQCT